MSTTYSLRYIWANILEKGDIYAPLAALLEGIRPLSILGAQVIYIGQPLLRGVIRDETLIALANDLEGRQSKVDDENSILEEDGHE